MSGVPVRSARSRSLKSTRSWSSFISLRRAYNSSSNILFITLALLLACLVLSGVLSWLTFYFSDKPIGASSFYAQVSGFIGKLFAKRHTQSLAIPHQGVAMTCRTTHRTDFTGRNKQ